MRCIVSGGGGFVGSNLAYELLKRGHDVLILDNYPNDPSSPQHSNLLRLEEEYESERVGLLKCDITASDQCSHYIKDADIVYHLAAETSHRLSFENPLKFVRANSLGTANVLEACKNNDMIPLVYASTCSIYGLNKIPYVESMIPDPRSPYAVSKYAGEMYCRLYNQLYGLKTVAVRFFNVYGRYCETRKDSVSWIFAENILRGEKPTVFGDKTSRDFTHVSDIVNGLMLAGAAELEEYDVFNLGAGVNTKITELAGMMLEEFGKSDLGYKLGSLGPGESVETLADCSKAKEVLGYAPRVGIRDGIKQYCQWHKELVKERRFKCLAIKDCAGSCDTCKPTMQTEVDGRMVWVCGTNYVQI